MGFHTLQWTQVRLTWTSGSTPYQLDIGSHKIQLGRSEYSEYSLYCNFSEYIRHIRYPFAANMPTQTLSIQEESSSRLRREQQPYFMDIR